MKEISKKKTMNHKRHKPRKQRGHCHFCKYYKDIGNSKNAKSSSRLKQEEKFTQDINNI